MSRKFSAAPTAAPKPVESDESKQSCVWIVPSDVRPSPDHLRGATDPEEQSAFEASIALDGVLQPILVRPLDPPAKSGEHYEVVAGHRRLEAAIKAGLTTIPATVKVLEQGEALRVQMIENLQRSDIHPLEEAEGFSRLMKRDGLSLAAISTMVSRSQAYIYDRMKLLELIPDARKLFLAGRFTLAHAVVLARLSPADQSKAMNLREPLHGGLFEGEATLWDPDETDRSAPLEGLKPRSVAELQAWVDEHVRFGPKVADPMLFPASAEALQNRPKVVAITFAHYLHPDARDGKTYGPRSWKRADGERHSKKCEHSILGYVAAGVHRGEAFEVCIAKERCEVHWGKEMRERKRNARDRELQQPAGKAGSRPDRQPREDPPALVKAVEAARDKAEDEIVRQVEQKVASMELVDLLRIHIIDARWDLQGYLEQMSGVEFGRNEKVFPRWVKEAPPEELKLALACEILEQHEGDSSFAGVNDQAIRKEFEKNARAEFARSQAKKEPAEEKGKKPTRPAKPSKPRKGKASR